GLVRGDKGDAQRLAAKGQRHLELRGGADSRGNAGHDGISDTSLTPRLDFLAAAAEHKGVAALQPHHALAELRRRDHELVDGLLADTRLADAAADRHARRVAANAVE